VVVLVYIPTNSVRGFQKGIFKMRDSGAYLSVGENSQGWREILVYRKVEKT
jgi:hypothetical protein